MRSLYIIRHAKSSWGNLALPDFDRPLNDRGKKDAPEMARRLLQRKVKIDAFVSSPAKRAKKTAKLFSEEFKVAESEIILAESLYNASEQTFYEVVSSMDDDHKHIAIFSHNPGITDFANSLVEGIKTDDMPTCAIFAIEIDTKKWSDFRKAPKKFLFYDYPKH